MLNCRGKNLSRLSNLILLPIPQIIKPKTPLINIAARTLFPSAFQPNVPVVNAALSPPKGAVEPSTAQNQSPTSPQAPAARANPANTTVIRTCGRKKPLAGVFLAG